MQLTQLRSRYEEFATIGKGGMGEVLAALDPVLDRKVAIKVMGGSGGSDLGAVKRFLAEARATGKLQHPSIPPVYELGKDERGSPFFAMRLIEGQSMAQLIEGLKAGDRKLHERFRFHHRLEIFVKICEALIHAHSQGVLHRDVKPANVMIGELGEVFLVDWGIARDDDWRQTVAGDLTIFGTPAFFAPELLQGGDSSAQTDSYSLMVTLYEWLTLVNPFERREVGQTLLAIITHVPEEACQLNHPIQGRVPKEMSNLVWKGLEKDPRRRFSSLEEVVEEARSILDGFSCPVCPHTAVKSGLNGLSRWIDNYPRMGLMGFFVLLISAALGWVCLALVVLTGGFW